jgi:hypothetical protein
MATKAQKRKAALEKREAFLKEERERGLAAQKADQQSRADEIKRIQEKNRLIDEKNKQNILAVAGSKKGRVTREDLLIKILTSDVTIGEFFAVADTVLGSNFIKK